MTTITEAEVEQATLELAIRPRLGCSPRPGHRAVRPTPSATTMAKWSLSVGCGTPWLN